MPHCARCRVDYEEGEGTCDVCGADLQPGGIRAAQGAPGIREEWAVLMRIRQEDKAEIIRGLLESEGVACQVIDKMAAQMPLPVSSTLSRFEIWVPGDRVDESREILNAARGETVACPGCGHMSAAGEPRCEYCGAASPGDS